MTEKEEVKNALFDENEFVRNLRERACFTFHFVTAARYFTGYFCYFCLQFIRDRR